MHILGTSFSSGAASNMIPSSVAVIDSNDAVVTNDGTAAVFITGGDGSSAHATLQHMTIGTSGHAGAALSLNLASTVSLQHVQLLQAFSNDDASSTLVVEDSTLAGAATNTSAGTTTIRRCNLQIGVSTTGGSFTYQRNAFVNPTSRAIAIGGNTTGSIENSTFSSNGAGISVIDLAMSGVHVQFVTIVNAQSSSAMPITCSVVGGQVDSSILAWNNTVLTNCQVNYSLFNGTTSQGGTNLAGNINTFFVDLSGQDLHLAAASPALRAADPTTTEAEDFSGTMRPNPAGTVRDIGAYESPN